MALIRGDLASARRYFAAVLATHAASAPAHFYTGYEAWKDNNTAVALAEFRQAASASAGAPPARVPGEGDTKRGNTSLRVGESRCNQLRALAERPGGSDTERDMARRYRELDDLLSATRRRAR